MCKGVAVMRCTTLLAHQPGRSWSAGALALLDNVDTNPESPSESVTTPWHLFGVFQNDPQWGQIFDEIERQRDECLIGD